MFPPAAITTLVDRPVGVSGVTNPQAASGGQDAQTIDEIRANAPLSVLTLGRAVSLDRLPELRCDLRGHLQGLRPLDSQRPVSRRLPYGCLGRRRRSCSPASQTLSYLVTALKNYGNPNVAINVQSLLRDHLRPDGEHSLRSGV